MTGLLGLSIVSSGVDCSVFVSSGATCCALDLNPANRDDAPCSQDNDADESNISNGIMTSIHVPKADCRAQHA